MSPTETGTVPLLGVDSMLFVYHFEAHEDFGPAAGEIFLGAEDGLRSIECSVHEAYVPASHHLDEPGSTSDGRHGATPQSPIDVIADRDRGVWLLGQRGVEELLTEGMGLEQLPSRKPETIRSARACEG